MKYWRVVLLAIGSAIAGALIALAIVNGVAKGTDQGQGAAAAPPERVSVVNGETVVAIDAAAAEKSHITAVPIAAARRSKGKQVFATAVDVKDLVDARNQFAVAAAQKEQARAHLVAVGAEYARLKALHDDNRNISDRVLQEAEANERAERANADAAAASMTAAEAGVRQRWGDAVASAFASNARWVDDLIANRSVLVQVVSPVQPQRRIQLQTADGEVAATFLSASPRTDARVQGRSWLYLAPAGAIVPGMNLTAGIGTANVQNGVLVPREAVVWTAGRAWAYVEKAPGQYARRAIDATVPMGEGYFVTTLQAGQRVVAAGAQELLSEENKPKVEE
jgi:membrane fusion protein, multidrug efflux system